MARSKKAQAAIDGALSIAPPDERVGLGVDLVEIDRMRKVLRRTPSFKEKVFSADEIAYCDHHADPAIHYAARFAAKEAAVKALGTGFAQGIAFHDIEVVRGANGKPSLVLKGKAALVAQEMGVRDIPLSLSHTAHDAIACVIAITEGSVAAARKRVDPAAELAKQFKEARSLLDELGAPVPDALETSESAREAGDGEDHAEADGAVDRNGG